MNTCWMWLLSGRLLDVPHLNWVRKHIFDELALTQVVTEAAYV